MHRGPRRFGELNIAFRAAFYASTELVTMHTRISAGLVSNLCRYCSGTGSRTRVENLWSSSGSVRVVHHLSNNLGRFNRASTNRGEPNYDGFLKSHAITIVYEDNHIVIIDKPSGLNSQPGAFSLGKKKNQPLIQNNVFDIMKEYFRQKRGKDDVENIYLGMVHRLDKETSGLMILTKTSKAAARLSEAMKNKTLERGNVINTTSSIEKVYLVVVHGHVSKLSDTLVGHLQLETDSTIMIQAASLSYQVLQRGFLGSSVGKSSYVPQDITYRNNECTWLEVSLNTGRKHQIRAQLSGIGHPIVGDHKYGGAKRSMNKKGGGIALHAFKLHFIHPVYQQQAQSSDIVSNIKFANNLEETISGNRYTIKEALEKVPTMEHWKRTMYICSDPSAEWKNLLKFSENRGP